MPVLLVSGSQAERVHKILLTHEWVSTEKILAKTSIPQASLSSVMTTLRRAGLAECRGTPRMPGGLRWKKHTIEKPKHPPQPDLIQRKNKRTTPTPQLKQIFTIDEIIDRLMTDIIALRDAVSQCAVERDQAVQQLSKFESAYEEAFKK